MTKHIVTSTMGCQDGCDLQGPECAISMYGCDLQGPECAPCTYCMHLRYRMIFIVCAS